MFYVQIGNGILEFAAEQTQLYEYLWQHAFISDSAHALITQSCKYPDDHPSALCESARKAAYSRIGNIDIYNIYSSTCHEQKVRPSASKCMVRMIYYCTLLQVEFNYQTA
jgi:serine carboxypeptidase-like clade 2